MRDFKASPVDAAPSSKWMRLRVRLLGLLFVAGLGGILYRSMTLQLRENAKLTAYARDQYLREIEVPARRGDILDRRGTPLAQSVEVDSVWIDPTGLTSPKTELRALATVLHLDERELLQRVAKGRRFAWVKRQITPQELSKVQALGIPGLGYTKEPRRFYPQRELAAHVLGFVGTDDHGLEGLEKAFESELSGDTVKHGAIRDARGRKVMTDGFEDGTRRIGANLELTLDRQIQYATERVLDRAVRESQGVAGSAVVLDPKTGEVLAVANSPRYNPNNPSAAPTDAIRNRAITDAFEPGSTYKPFIVAGAVEAGLLNARDKFDCEHGSLRIGKHVIHDMSPNGILELRDVLRVSSNICMSKVAQVLGRERFQRIERKFGFGERTTLGLPQEARGVIPVPQADITLATNSFGQGLTASALQIAAAYGALANKGLRMRPYLVSRVVDADGQVLIQNAPQAVEQVISERTAKEMVAMLEGVVGPKGTGRRAAMTSYRVAGKTGTAQKADPVARGYSNKTIVSFAGFVPAEDPRAVIVVVIDEPKSDSTGGAVAAPAFRDIAQETMAYLGVSPSHVPQEAAPVAVAVRAPPLELAVASAVTSDDDPPGEGNVRVPDVIGVAAREAVRHLLGATLMPQVRGSGFVMSQLPEPGAVVPKGATVSLVLGERRAGVAP